MSSKKRSRWMGGVSGLALLLLLSGAFLIHSVQQTSAANAASDAKSLLSWQAERQMAEALKQKMSKAPLNAEAMRRGGNNSISTIPYWTSSFTDQGVEYPYSMVGTDPAKGSASTTIKTIIIPLDFTLATGEVYAGSSNVRNVLDSALYKPAKLNTGTTQYADEIQRAEFWNYVSTKSKNYHVLLKNVDVLPIVKLAVPADKGKVFDTSLKGSDFGKVANIDGAWFIEQFTAVYSASTANLPGDVVPIFLTGNVLLDGGIGGLHSASIDNTPNGVKLTTFIYSSYFNEKHDLDALSHEVSELFNDPFGNNYVRPWQTPDEPQYGCSSVLEVGDPLVHKNFNINGHFFQDEAYIWWFARATSQSLKGQYSYLGNFKTVAPDCVPATPTPAPSTTATPVPSPTTTVTPVPSPTTTATPVPSPTTTATPVPSPTTTVTPVPSPTTTPVPSPTATATPAPTATVTAAATQH